MKKFTGLNTIRIYGNDEFATFAINPKIYSLDVIHSAAYILIDKAFILLDGNPTTKILIEIRKKNKNQSLMNLIIDFNEQLLNYAVYKNQSEKNKTIRETMLQKILLANDPNYFSAIETKKESAVPLKDPNKITKLWNKSCAPEQRKKK